MDLFETLGLGPRQPEQNELYVALYADPHDPALGPPPGLGDDEEEGAAPGPRSEADRLEALRARCTAWLLPYTAGYVWNKDPLTLRSSARQQPPWERAAAQRRRRRQGQGQQAPGAGAGAAGSGEQGRQQAEEGCLWAVMRFGDAVDDEWWAVWLLLRMSRELQDLTVQVWDNDGQFLLIEAAYALPRWLKPETAEHRVWLRHGRLHLLPLPSAAAPDLPASPSRQQALDILRQGRYATAAPKVQRPIDERLAGYPAAARLRQQHTARCLLPAPLAEALRSEPQLVAELVEAFYYRDADDMRAAARMRHLPPSLDRAPALVCMTRCHYAQLAQQRFAPPRGMPSHLPPGAPADGPLARAADLGLKLTVAAEILCARHAAASGLGGAGGGGGGAAAGAGGAGGEGAATGGGEAGAVEQAGAGASGADGAVGPGVVPGQGALTEAGLVAAHPEAWRRFKAALEARSYFDGNIAGSRRYKELLAAAMEAFLAGRAEAEAAAAEAEAGQAGSSAAAAIGGRARDPRRRLAELVMWAAAHPEAAAAAAGSSDTAGPGNSADSLAEDDDSWLDEQPERLQAELERRQAELQEHVARRTGQGQDEGEAAGAVAAAPQPVHEVDAEDIASKLRGFMEQLSGLEGAEVREQLQEEDEQVGPEDAPATTSPAVARATATATTTAPSGGAGAMSRGEGQAQAKGRRRGERADGGDGVAFDAARFLRELQQVLGQAAAAAGQGAGDGDEEGEDESEGEGESSGDEGSSFFSDDDMDDGEEAEEDGEEGEEEQEDDFPAEAQPATSRRPHAAQTGGASASGSGASAAASPATHANRLATGTAAAGAATSSSKPLLKRGFLSGPGSAGGVPAEAGGTPSASGGAAATAAARTPAAHRAQPQRRQPGLSWEVDTATDSDDDDEDRTDGDEDGEDEEEVDATAQLMAALGVEDELEAEAAGGPAAAARRDKSAAARAHRSGGAPSAAMASTTTTAAATSRSKPSRGPRDDGFNQLYDMALQAELAGTTLAHSFQESGAAPPPPSAGAGPAAGHGPASTGGRGPQAVAEEALAPVDLDMNLVRNLLRSYTAQQGTAGPAGNIAAMLGMSLPAGDIE